MLDKQKILMRRAMLARHAKAPNEPCHKCGAFVWDKDVEPGTWYCFKCGNLGFVQGDGFYQQSDVKRPPCDS